MSLLASRSPQAVLRAALVSSSKPLFPKRLHAKGSSVGNRGWGGSSKRQRAHSQRAGQARSSAAGMQGVVCFVGKGVLTRCFGESCSL